MFLSLLLADVGSLVTSCHVRYRLRMWRCIGPTHKHLCVVISVVCIGLFVVVVLGDCYCLVGLAVRVR